MEPGLLQVLTLQIKSQGNIQFLPYEPIGMKNKEEAKSAGYDPAVHTDLMDRHTNLNHGNGL